MRLERKEKHIMFVGFLIQLCFSFENIPEAEFGNEIHSQQFPAKKSSLAQARNPLLRKPNTFSEIER